MALRGQFRANRRRMDPMTRGQAEVGTAPTPVAVAPPRRGVVSAVVLAVALVGCGESADRDADLPPLPKYWQGSISGPRPDAWALQGIQPSTAVPAVPAESTSAVTYAVPSLPAAIADLNGEPADDQALEATPAAEGQFVVESASELADAAAPGMLLPPQPVEASPAYEPAPTDVIVVDAMPVLRAPAPESFAQPPAAPQFAAQPQATVAPFAPAAAPVALMPAAPPTAARHSASEPTGAVVNERAGAKIRRGYELAERGAYFAARNEFEGVLRMIAEAKDQLHGAPRRTLALAEGLRALDEAADFAPAAAAGAANVRLSVVVASHQTPVAKPLAVDDMLPPQIADLYLEYAGRQLGAAVAGEPTGSVALHALGKLHSRLGRVEPEQNPLADRAAFALQQAALHARPDNHLAAHELGVLLAEGGHYPESGQLLRQVAQHAPHPVVYRNLARVERRLGQLDHAIASERHAEYLAARGVDGLGNVRWVQPDALARQSDPLAPAATPMMARGPAPTQR
jgi:tetratricopeptide (TPR) repeat protein